MNANKIQELVNGMDPKEAASAIGKVMKNLFPLLDEEVRLKFTESLAGESAGDKLASMVHY